MLSPLVLKDALEQVPGYTDIERAAAAGHHICKVAALMHTAHGTGERSRYAVTKNNCRSFPFAALGVRTTVAGRGERSPCLRVETSAHVLLSC